jgi:hypothetical protein
MCGYIPPPPKPSKPLGYELLSLCEDCAKRRARKGAHRAELTLLPSEYRLCRDCGDAHTCHAYRDYGKD